MSRRLLITRLSEHFGEDLLVLSSPGIATILAFKSRTAKVLHIIPDVDDDDIENAVNKVKKKNQTKIDVSARQVSLDSPCIVTDGCALLWIPHWPPSSPTQQPTVMDYVNKFKDMIKERLSSGDVYLVFDRYEDFSTKYSTRISRGSDGCRVFQLSPTAPLPSQKLMLTVTQNKKQLIDIICKDIQQDTDFLQKHTEMHKLVITGQDKTPVEISVGGVIIHRHMI